jgi:MYXO-CTERM domain-containing protein
MIIHLMAEDQGGQPAGLELSQRWADEFGLTFPVLADPGWTESNKYEQDFGIPTFHLLGRDLTIRILDGSVSENAIQDALDEPIPEVDWDEPPGLDELVEVDADEAEPVASESPFEGTAETPYGGCSANVAASPPTSWAALPGLFGLTALGRRRRRT